MPLTTWKILLRRADQASYHYVATIQRGREPEVGEHIERTVGARTIKWTISEIFKDHSSQQGIFSVKVDETEEGKPEMNETRDTPAAIETGRDPQSS
jgi:hypothetical protein